MQGKQSNFDKYLILILALSVLYFGYWIIFGNYMYASFNSNYFDIGGWAYNMYLHVHNLNGLGLLQYLVFFNHISPFSVLLVPIFALYQQPITLVIIQDSFLLITTVLAYFVSLDILKDRKVAFALAFAFLINPGLRGLLIFDFHTEAFIPFFCILSFYFYFKGKRTYFVLSLVMLLSVMETTYAVAAPLLLGLLVYELLYNSRRTEPDREEFKRRIATLLLGMLVTALAFGAYHMASVYITNAYSAHSNYAIPPITRLYIDFIGDQLKALNNPVSTNYNSSIAYYLGGTGASYLFLGFGAASSLSVPVGVVFYLPWLFEVFVIHNLGFAFFGFQYYAYALGGSFIAAVLGFLIFSKNKKSICKKLRADVKAVEVFMFASIIVFAVVFSVVGLSESDISLFTLQPHPNINYAQMSNALAAIPENASVMAQAPIAAHLFYIHNLELPPIYNKTNSAVLGYLTVYWFVPDYIAIDKNLSNYYYLTHYNLTNQTFNVYQYMGKNYTISYNNSDLYIYKRIRIGLNGTQN